MKKIIKKFLIIGLSIFYVTPANIAHAILINYEAADLVDAVAGEDLWQYTYTLSDHSFDMDTGFTIFFDDALYAFIDPLPQAPNADWDILTWNPDPNLPDDGAYDALALVDNPSLVAPFSVSFVWLGSGTPGAQPFHVYDGLTFDVIASDTTAAGPEAPVPEPGTLLLLGMGFVGLSCFRKRRTTKKGDSQ